MFINSDPLKAKNEICDHIQIHLPQSRSIYVTFNLEFSYNLGWETISINL